jgi:phosphopantetheine adenylyltransferase
MSSALQEAIIVLGGSFSPPHTGHLAALEEARRDAERKGFRVVAGYLVCAQDSWLKYKLQGRGEDAKQLLSFSAKMRLRMTNAAAAETSWVQPTDHVEYSAKKFGKEIVGLRHKPGTKVYEIKGASLPALSKDRHGNELSSSYIRREIYAGGVDAVHRLTASGALPPAVGRILEEVVLSSGLSSLDAAVSSAGAGACKRPAAERPVAAPGVRRARSWGEASLVAALPPPEAAKQESTPPSDSAAGEEGYVSAALPSEAGASSVAPLHTFKGEWDEEGVWFYQAYNDAIASWAVAHQTLGGPAFNASRMTWIKPSFAWVLYRAGYGRKHSQERILKIKLPHAAVSSLLSRCACKHGGGGAKGRVQWDPARDLFTCEDKGRAPRRMLRERAIQIGLSGDLSERFVASIIAVTDVTELAHRVGAAHAAKDVAAAMAALAPELPAEREYLPRCEPAELVRLQMRAPAPTADGFESCTRA